MEAIAGAFPLEDGAILLDGKNVSTLPVQQRHLGIVYQDHALFPHLTVRDNIDYGLKMAKTPRRKSTSSSSELFTATFDPAVRAFLGRDSEFFRGRRQSFT